MGRRQRTERSATEPPVAASWALLFGNVVIGCDVMSVAGTLDDLAQSLQVSVALAMAVVLVPWALGCFATNSGQQARLGLAAPSLAPALMALNTSAMYSGQAAGSSSGGWPLAHHGDAPLSWVGLLVVQAAMGPGVWSERRAQAEAHG